MTQSPNLSSTKPAPATAEAPVAQLSPQAVRKENGLTQLEMAELLGMSEFGYTEWESGNRRAGGPAYRLLHLIDRDGDQVLDALRAIPS